MEVGLVGGCELGCGSCRGGALVGAEHASLCAVLRLYSVIHFCTGAPPGGPTSAAVREPVDFGREGREVADGVSVEVAVR